MAYELTHRGKFWGQLSNDGRLVLIRQRGHAHGILVVTDDLGDLAEIIAEARNHKANTAPRIPEDKE
jgi:hypothetical protein